jgi:hypothetical protein
MKKTYQDLSMLQCSAAFLVICLIVAVFGG